MQTIVIAVVGSLFAFVQTLVFFILKDVRERIMRLETNQMKGAT